MIGRRIQRDRKGGYRLRLPAEERELLRWLPEELHELLRAEGRESRTRASAACSLPRTRTTTPPTTSTGG